jgi:hypothetical protein
MKTKKVIKKLDLNKKTISDLNSNVMSFIAGGDGSDPCGTYRTCDPTMQGCRTQDERCKTIEFRYCTGECATLLTECCY